MERRLLACKRYSDFYAKRGIAAAGNALEDKDFYCVFVCHLFVYCSVVAACYSALHIDLSRHQTLHLSGRGEQSDRASSDRHAIMHMTDPKTDLRHGITVF